MGNAVLTVYMSYQMTRNLGYQQPTQSTQDTKTKEVTYKFNPMNKNNTNQSKTTLPTIPEEEHYMLQSPITTPK